MNRPAHAKWLERAEYDLDTAEAMITTARYIYAVFMCQQAVEIAQGLAGLQGAGGASHP